MMQNWKEKEGRKPLPAPLPAPQIKGRKSWEQRVNRNEEAAEEELRVWETGKPEKGRKEEIHGGGGTRKGRAERMGGCKRHRALTSAAGAATVTREGRDISWDRPGRSPPPGAQRLITRGLRGHMKQMTLIAGLLPLPGKRDSGSFRERPRPQTPRAEGAERSPVKGSPSFYRGGNGGRLGQHEGRAGAHVSWDCGGIRSRSPDSSCTAASLHEKCEKWVCFLEFYRVTEGKARVPTEWHCAQQLLFRSAQKSEL